MRITGGAARGIPLGMGKNAAARPATDRLRQAVFSSLGAAMSGARFFDLFAGSGAYGLEAWSRGAAGGIFVEKSRAMVQAIGRNVEAVARSVGRSGEVLQVVAADATRWSPAPGDRANLIFIDPPYELIAPVGPALMEKLAGWLEPGGVVVFEMPGGTEIAAPGWKCIKRLGKGRHQPSCCFYQLVGEER